MNPILINGVQLSPGQQMAVEVAIAIFMVALTRDSDFIRGLGPELTSNYKDRLLEISKILQTTPH